MHNAQWAALGNSIALYIEAHPGMIITINENVDFGSAEFSIYKSNAQSMTHSYLIFNEAVTQAPQSIKIKEMNKNEFLENEDKVLIIHQPSVRFSNETCKSWANTVNGDYKGECVIEDEYNEGDNSVYASRVSD